MRYRLWREPVPLRHDFHGDGCRVRRGEQKSPDECCKRREADIKVPAGQGEDQQVLGRHLQEDEGGRHFTGGAAFGTDVDVVTDLIAGREINLLQTF